VAERPIEPDDIQVPRLPKTAVGGYRVDATNQLFLRVAWDLRTLQAEERRLREQSGVLERELANAREELGRLRARLDATDNVHAGLQATNDELTTENAQRVGEVAALQAELSHLRERQGTAESALAAAQDAARQLRASARRDAEATLKKARGKAQSIVAAAERDRRRLGCEIERLHSMEAATREKLRAMLVSTLESLDGQRERGGPDLPQQLNRRARKRRRALDS
jgi:cell division septum initiation protein DivIVA